MTHGHAHPPTHGFFGDALRGNEPYLSGTSFEDFLKNKAKTSMEIAFIAVITAWAFIVPLFKDSLIQAIGNWLRVP